MVMDMVMDMVKDMVMDMDMLTDMDIVMVTYMVMVIDMVMDMVTDMVMHMDMDMVMDWNMDMHVHVRASTSWRSHRTAASRLRRRAQRGCGKGVGARHPLHLLVPVCHPCVLALARQRRGCRRCCSRWQCSCSRALQSHRRAHRGNCQRH